MLLFTVVAVVLYVVADRVLDRVEVARGRRFEQRSVIFFFILLGLAVSAFALIQSLFGG